MYALDSKLTFACKVCILRPQRLGFFAGKLLSLAGSRGGSVTPSQVPICLLREMGLDPAEFLDVSIAPHHC